MWKPSCPHHRQPNNPNQADHPGRLQRGQCPPSRCAKLGEVYNGNCQDVLSVD
jgi:hypothetical protein